MTARRSSLVCIVVAMLAFAGNSLLCRMALTLTSLDPVSFTTIRLASGALALCAILRWRTGGGAPTGNWPSAIALFVYAAAISFAYTQLTAATGALVLFGAVQLTMVGYSAMKGEKVLGWRIIGLAVASAGLVALLSPGVSAPPLPAAAGMFAAGAAWGVYSIRGGGVDEPLRATAGNFLRAVVPALVLSLAMISKATADPVGIMYAVASGAAASGIGYALWYAALPAMDATTAAAVQLTVPLITAGAALVLLDETLTPRAVTSAAAILAGVAIVVFNGSSKRRDQS